MGRQFTNKSHGIRNQEREVADHHFSDSGIEGSKQFIFSEDIRFAKLVHQGRFTHIGITYQCHLHHLSPVLPLVAHLAVDLLQLLLQPADLIPDYPPVSLNLCLSGSAQSDSSTLSLQVGPHTCKPWKKVLILSKLHLYLGMSSLCTLGKNIENQVGAVKNSYFQFSLNIPQLGR